LTLGSRFAKNGANEPGLKRGAKNGVREPQVNEP